MSEHLKRFLLDLASDPERMSRFEANPAGELDGAALSEEEKTALLSRDSARIRRALGAGSDHMTWIVFINKKPLPQIKAKNRLVITVDKKENGKKKKKRSKKGKG